MIPLRDTQPSHSVPLVTIALIVVNTIVFLYQAMLDDYSLNHFIVSYGVVPDRLEPMTLVTSMFLHGGWLHLIGNMWFLWIFGDNVEDILGRWKYLLFYLCAASPQLSCHVVTNPYSRIPTVGASGAIAGVMGAYMLKFPHSRILTLDLHLHLLYDHRSAGDLSCCYWVLIQLFSGAGSIGYSQASQGGVAFLAHVGGFWRGHASYNAVADATPYRRRPELHW